MRWRQVNIHLARKRQKQSWNAFSVTPKATGILLGVIHLRCFISPLCPIQCLPSLPAFERRWGGKGSAPPSAALRGTFTPLYVKLSSLTTKWDHTMRKLTPWWLACKEFCIFSILHSKALTTVCLSFLSAYQKAGGNALAWRVWDSDRGAIEGCGHFILTSSQVSIAMAHFWSFNRFS